MKLYITRHGQTEENNLRVIQSQTNWTLSGEWERQVESLAKFLSEVRFDIIITSDASRAQQTSEIVLKYQKQNWNSDVKIILDKRLRERNYGKFVGMTHEERNQMYPGLTKEEKYLKWGAETSQSMYDRAHDFYEDIRQKRKGKNVLCVGHIRIDSKLMDVIERLPSDADFRRLANASLSTYEMYWEHLERVAYNQVFYK